MNSRLSTLVALTVCLLPLSRATAQTEQQKQTMVVLKSASERLMRGDITALDDVKALPGDDSVAGLLMFFKQNFYVFSKETQKKAIAAKAAEYITVCPTAGDYIKRLFKKEAGRPKSGMLMNYRQTTLDSLTSAKNPFAIRLLFELMDETELEVRVGDFSVALAKMDLPSAPYSSQSRKGADTPDGIAKWRSWWEANRGEYAK
jgi:hypothetical protein